MSIEKQQDMQKKIRFSFIALCLCFAFALINGQVGNGNVIITGLLTLSAIIAAIGQFQFQEKLNDLLSQQARSADEYLLSKAQDNTNVEQYLDLAHQIIDVWAGQTELARGQGDENINQLANNFAQIKDQLAEAIPYITDNLWRNEW